MFTNVEDAREEIVKTGTSDLSSVMIICENVGFDKNKMFFNVSWKLALLFSIETQHTIGYGSRYITTECMGGILVLTLQSLLEYLLQVIVTQIVFTKLSRPTGEEKSQFIIFSNYPLIAPRNNQVPLTFRIVNLSTS
ncbi:unnamed protein product [Rotaria sp. Silwood1]|nr:unnamed protein product [Rotaria sp. Silwood1]